MYLHKIFIKTLDASFDKKSELRRFVRFCAVGLLNTAVTFVTFTLLRAVGVDIYVSNVLSYAAGVVNSFFWNKTWVYRSREKKFLREALLFLLFFAICYGVQLLVFKAALHLLPESVSQLCGMAVYSVCNFILNRLFTFNDKKQQQ